MKRAHATPARPAIEMLEAALQLLRAARAGALLCYYIGSAPCLLGLLYFWADMSRGAFARAHLAEASLGAALLYLWMKCWQTVFASKLRAHLLLEAEMPWTPRRIARLALTQSAIQPIGLFARLLAAQILLPYVWTYSFFQNVGVLGDGTRAGLGEVLRASAKQASLWIRQAHVALLCVFAFAFFIWINVCIVVALVPVSLKTLLGIQTAFSRSGWAMVNSTTFAATLAATYLCFDPIRKAFFVLRLFYGASLRSGEDLRVELKTARSRAGAVTALALLLALSGFAGSARAADSPPPSVASTELSQSLDDVLQRREYAWRFPRERAAEQPEANGWLGDFFDSVGQQMKRAFRKSRDALARAFKWLRKFFNREPKPSTPDFAGKIDWPAAARWALVALLAALLVILGALLWRARNRRRQPVAQAQPLAAAPDLADENVTADQLPEDGWLDLARDLMQRGELRLAMRASYLAGLAHLGRRELIRIAKYKSNRDYDRELRRRARANSELLDAFDLNRNAFERAWYGEHGVTAEHLGNFSQNLDRIRAC